MKNFHNIEHKKNFDGSRTGYARAGVGGSSIYRIKGRSGNWFAYQKNGNGFFSARTLEDVSKKLESL